MSESWTWSYHDAAGDELTAQGSATSFPSQAEAEAWIGEAWTDLLEDGVDSVTLRNGDHIVYGPMSLHEAQ